MSCGFVCIEFDKTSTAFSVQRHVSQPRSTVLTSVGLDEILGSRVSTSATKDDTSPMDAMKPIGSNLAVNQVLRMSTQPRNSRLAPIVDGRVLCRVFRSPSEDPVSSWNLPGRDPVRLSGVSKDTEMLADTAAWRVCLRCLDVVDSDLQLPKIYYQRRVGITCSMSVTELCSFKCQSVLKIAGN